MTTDDRQTMALSYRKKADESYVVALECFEKKHYRGTCNRAWYAVFQLITAAAYEELTATPGANRPNWAHEKQADLFKEIVRKRGQYERYRHFMGRIGQMLERRYDADYRVPDEPVVGKEEAEQSIRLAAAIRDIFVLQNAGAA